MKPRRIQDRIPMICIREMRLDDIASIIKIRGNTRENSLSPEQLSEAGITEKYIAALLTTTHFGWIGAIDNEYCAFVIVDGKFGEIWSIAVIAAREGCGLGRMLLEKATRYLFSLGFDRISLETPSNPETRAHKLYTTAGWEKTFHYGDVDVYSLTARPSH